MFKRSNLHEVEVQITPMLDMAFQILAFFIMTYNPMPLEGQFAMSLLPVEPQVQLEQAPAESEDEPNPEIPAEARTLTTTLYARADGSLDRAVIGENELFSLREVQALIEAIRADASQPFDRAEILADPQLKYEELIRVVDIYMSVGINEIGFGEASFYGGGPGL